MKSTLILQSADERTCESCERNKAAVYVLFDPAEELAIFAVCSCCAEVAL